MPPRDHLIGLLGVLLLTAALYAPTLGHGFTNWDDGDYVVENPLLRDLSPGGLTQIFSTTIHGNYHPLTILSLAFDHSVGGLDPRVYHATNLLLHLLDTALVFLLIHRLGHGRPEAAWIAALLFGIHPMHVESVAWVSERKDVLYTAFFLAGLLCWLRWDENGRHASYRAALALCAAALLSKPAAVTFAPTALLLSWYRRGSLERRHALASLPLFALAAVAGILTLGIAGAGVELGPAQRVAVAGTNLVAYVAKLAVPVGLSAIVPYPDWNEGMPWWILAGPIAALAAAALVLASLRRTRTVAFGFAFYAINVAPTLQLVSVGQAMMADRYTYVPSIGLFFLIGAGVEHLRAAGGRRAAPAAVAIVAAACIAYGALARERVRVWRDSGTLFDDVIAKHPDLAMAWYKRGQHWNEMGLAERALRDHRRAVELDPQLTAARYDLGNLLRAAGDDRGAIREYTTALLQDPHHLKALNNRGNAWFDLGDRSRALADYDTALGLDPDFPDARVSRGRARLETGDAEGALQDLERAVALAPGSPVARYWRGRARAESGDREGAREDLESAQRLGYPVRPSELRALRR